MKTTFHVAANLIWYNLILTMTYLHLNLEWFCILYRKLKLGVRILLRRSVLDTTLCDKVCRWLATGWWFSRGTTLCDKVCQWLVTVWWFSPGTLLSSTNKTDCHDIAEILLKVVLNTKSLTPARRSFIRVVTEI